MFFVVVKFELEELLVCVYETPLSFSLHVSILIYVRLPPFDACVLMHKFENNEWKKKKLPGSLLHQNRQQKMLA